MKVINLMEEYLQWIKAEKGYAQTTVKAYEYDILLFLKWYKEQIDQSTNELELQEVKLGKIQLDDLRGFVVYLSQERKNSNSTRCRKIACLKSFWNYLSKVRKLTKNIASDLSLPKKEQTTQIYLKQREINKLFKTIELDSRNIIRDKCILATLLYTGIRVSECVGLDLSDVDLENKTLRIMNGKGGNARMIGMNEELVPFLTSYLKNRTKNSINNNPLFISERKKRISKRTLQYHFKQWVESAGLSDEVTIHKCRHTFLSHLCQNGASLSEIKQISGHKHLASLQRYLHNDQKRLNEIVNKVSYNGK